MKVSWYDDCDIDDMLNQLQKHNFILRYKVNGVGYIQILTFEKHQNPHKNEKESDIPPYSQADSGENQEMYSTSTVQVLYKYSAKTIQVEKKTEALGLILRFLKRNVSLSLTITTQHVNLCQKCKR